MRSRKRVVWVGGWKHKLKEHNTSTKASNSKKISFPVELAWAIEQFAGPTEAQPPEKPSKAFSASFTVTKQGSLIQYTSNLPNQDRPDVC